MGTAALNAQPEALFAISTASSQLSALGHLITNRNENIQSKNSRHPQNQARHITQVKYLIYHLVTELTPIGLAVVAAGFQRRLASPVGTAAPLLSRTRSH